MNRLISLALVLLVGMFSFSAHASAVTVNFEEFNVGDSAGGISGFPPLQSQGYDIYGNIVFDPAEVLIGTNTGTKSFGGSESGFGQDGFGVVVEVTFERTDGGAFAIHSLDALVDTDPDGSTLITGVLAGGGAANLSDPVGTGDWLNLESINFRAEGNQWGFGTATVEIDNISVTAVPVPAAVWLFGSALGGLGWMKRRRAA